MPFNEGLLMRKIHSRLTLMEMYDMLEVATSDMKFGLLYGRRPNFRWSGAEIKQQQLSILAFNLQTEHKWQGCQVVEQACAAPQALGSLQTPFLAELGRHSPSGPLGQCPSSGSEP